MSAALHLAAAAGSVALTKLLLGAGASVEHVVDGVTTTSQGHSVRSKSTALCLAARADAVDVAELLCEAGAVVDPVDREGRPLEHGPLANAAEHGCLVMVRFLIARGAKLDLGLDGHQFNPLNCALARRHYRVAALLIEAGANFDAKPRRTLCRSWEARPRPPFAFACELIQSGRDRAQALALATLMVERGLDANASSGPVWLGPENRPIYAAIASGEPHLVGAVIAAGADVRGWVGGDDLRSFQSWKLEFDGAIYMTPLDFATALGCPEIIAMVSSALCLADC
jgi:ankyrin repeat protein